MSEYDEQTGQDFVIFDKKKFAFLTTRPIGMTEKIAVLIALGKKQNNTTITETDN